MEEFRKEPVTILLIALNILVFLAVETTGSSQDVFHMLNCGASYTPLVLHFGISHLANNMLVLFVLGSRLERVTGKVRFLIIYLLGGLAGNILSMLMELSSREYAVSAGASGAVFAVMGAMIYVVVRNRGWLEDLSMRQILVMAIFSLYFGLTSSGVDNAAHIGGMISGLLLAVILYHPRKRI